jgi:hypothetical protein
MNFDKRIAVVVRSFTHLKEEQEKAKVVKPHLTLPKAGRRPKGRNGFR